MSKRSKNRKLSRQGKIAVQAAALSPPPPGDPGSVTPGGGGGSDGGGGWVPVDVTPSFYLDAYMLRQLAEHPQQVQRTVSLSEYDARIRLTALTLLPGKA